MNLAVEASVAAKPASPAGRSEASPSPLKLPTILPQSEQGQTLHRLAGDRLRHFASFR